MRHFFEKILALLRVRSVVGGLEVSDEVIRLGYFDGKVWQLHAIRLSPGIMEKGVIKNKEALIVSLTELKLKSGIAGQDVKKKVDVVVSLSSATPYSKVFRLPEIEGNELDKAIELNIAMASPGTAQEFYSGWQIAGRDHGARQVDILSAFIDRAPVDGIVDVLFAAGFVAMAVESKALAITRVFREKGLGIDIAKPYIVVTVDNVGMEFLVIRNGQLYFEYAHRWTELENEKGEMPISSFEAELTTSLHQVLNFYAQQWTEPIAAVVLSVVAFNTEIEKTIAEAVALPVVRLTLVMGQPISSEWLAALGCSLRGNSLATAERQVSFLGVELEDRFRQEEMLRFLEFWQVVVPVSLVLLVGAFAIGEIFLQRTQAEVEVTSGYTLPPAETVAMNNLIASSSVFNAEIIALQGIENNNAPNEVTAISNVQSIASQNGITISTLVSSVSSQASLSGVASSEDQISAFKNAMSSDPNIKGVYLPLTGITPQGATYAFSMTFSFVTKGKGP